MDKCLLCGSKYKKEEGESIIFGTIECKGRENRTAGLFMCVCLRVYLDLVCYDRYAHVPQTLRNMAVSRHDTQTHSTI